MPKPMINSDIFAGKGGLEPKRALAYLQKRGEKLTPTGNWKELKAEEHYNAFTVAQSYKADVLQDIYDAVEKAKKEGWSVKKFQEELEPTLKAKGWWGYDVDPKTGKTIELGTPRRLKIILETNKWTSHARGEYKMLMRRAKRRPILKYNQKHRKTRNEAHTKFDGKYYWYNDPIVRRIFPPSMYGCGCYFEPLSVEQALKETGKTDIKDVVSSGKDLEQYVESNEGDFVIQPLKVYDPVDEKPYPKEIRSPMKEAIASAMKEKVKEIAKSRQGIGAKTKAIKEVLEPKPQKDELSEMKTVLGRAELRIKQIQMDIEKNRVPSSRTERKQWLSDLIAHRVTVDSILSRLKQSNSPLNARALYLKEQINAMAEEYNLEVEA